MATVTHPSGYRIGAATATHDGARGTVSAIVVDPRTRTVTHLAVEPVHRPHQARLVPIALASAEPAGDVRIACDDAMFRRFDELEHVEIIDLGPAGPYGAGGWGASVDGVEHLSIWTDRPPEGEQALHRGIPVRSDVDTIGELDGLLVGPDSRVTAILVSSGRLWSRRTIAVPVDAVTRVDADGLTISASWDQVRVGPDDGAHVP